MTDKNYRLSKMRDLTFLKPTRFSQHVTISELSKIVDREVSWLRQLEREGRIPKASRVQRGQLSVRLWSPVQVEEIQEILSRMKPGRPKASV
jgi:hypothetical protein